MSQLACGRTTIAILPAGQVLLLAQLLIRRDKNIELLLRSREQFAV